MVLRPVAATHHITTTIHGACQALLLLLSTAANALATALQIDGTPLPDFADLAGLHLPNWCRRWLRLLRLNLGY